MAVQPLNLFDFGEGHLNFMVKIPAHVSFQIGIIDSWGNQSYVEFPAHQTTYGLVRDGEWGQASIPVSEIRGEFIDLRMLSYPFVILEVNGTPCEFALDDIYWDDGIETSVEEDGFSDGAGSRLLSNVPNPFNGSTQIHFELSGSSDYELEIFDIRGRRVTTLGGQGQAGVNTIPWNGRDDQGEKVSSGVYFYRLESAAGTAVKRMVLVR